MEKWWKNDGWHFDSLWNPVLLKRSHFQPSFVENEPMSGTMLQKSFSQTCQKKVPQQKIAKSFPNTKKCPKWFSIHHYTYIIHICSITINIFTNNIPLLYLYHCIIHHIYIPYIIPLLYHQYCLLAGWIPGHFPKISQLVGSQEAQPKDDWKNSRALTWSGENGRNCYGND